MRARSALLRSTSSAPIFSCKYLRRFVPGIGTMSLPCASTQASAICAGVHFFSRAIVIIEVDYIDIEPAQASFAGFSDVIGLAADPAKLGFVWIAHDSKFRRNDDLFATPF